MATCARNRLLKGSAAVGAVALSFAGYQRLASSREGDSHSQWSRSLKVRSYRVAIKPFLICTDPEFAHSMTLNVGSIWQRIRLLREPLWTGPWPFDWLFRPTPSKPPPMPGPKLRQEVLGLKFESPVGYAAGFDKNGVLVPLVRLGALCGFGFAEVGSVSALPCAGNPRPRCARLREDEAVINRYGLPNQGADIIAARLESSEILGRASSPSSAGTPRAPIGVNVVKTHDPSINGKKGIEDVSTCFKKMAPRADFIVLNVSCPNTREGKTFEDSKALQELLKRISYDRKQLPVKPPILLKLSLPCEGEVAHKTLKEIVRVAQASSIIDGYVVGNSTADLEVPLSAKGRKIAEAFGKGGLSGKPIADRATATIREIYRITNGAKPIIGVGGVDSAEAAYKKIRMGACLLELYVGIVYNGPGLPADINRGLRRLLERDGFKSVSEAVGVDAWSASTNP